MLRSKAYEAVRRKKIFTVYGRDAKDIRKALLNRGWVEKLPPGRMIVKLNFKLSETSQETTLLSSFLQNYHPNFIWAGKLNKRPWTSCHNDLVLARMLNQLQDCKITKDNKREHRSDNTIVSRLKVNVKYWCSKTGLCTSLKDTTWHYIEDVAEVYAPRTYINTNRNDLIDFVNDYLLTACTGLLRWILSNLRNGNPIFSRTGNISINVMVFALNRCKEYLNKKANKDIDGEICRVTTSGQWNSFLMKYQSVITGKDVFKLDNKRNITLLTVYAHFLLEQILTYRPQLKCEGCHNVWIIKPSNLSLGTGIKMLSDLNGLLNTITKTTQKYVVQKYIGKNYSTYS